MWGSWSGHHPQDDLAKFVYRSETKVKIIIKNCAKFWLTCLTYLARFGVFKQKKIPPRDFGPFFPPQKTPFYDE
jgi:hypothetical protein